MTAVTSSQSCALRNVHVRVPGGSSPCRHFRRIRLTEARKVHARLWGNTPRKRGLQIVQLGRPGAIQEDGIRSPSLETSLLDDWDSPYLEEDDFGLEVLLATDWLKLIDTVSVKLQWQIT